MDTHTQAVHNGRTFLLNVVGFTTRLFASDIRIVIFFKRVFRFLIRMLQFSLSMIKNHNLIFLKLFLFNTVNIPKAHLGSVVFCRYETRRKETEARKHDFKELVTTRPLLFPILKPLSAA